MLNFLIYNYCSEINFSRSEPAQKLTPHKINQLCIFDTFSDLLLFLQAIQGLNGMALGDKKLVVQRASVGAKVIEEYDMTTDITSMAMPISIPGLQMPSTAQTATTVLCLMNMTTEDELGDDEEYEGMRMISYHLFIIFIIICYLCVFVSGILEDVREECSNYGQVLSVAAPRPIEGMLVPGLGKVQHIKIIATLLFIEQRPFPIWPYIN